MTEEEFVESELSYRTDGWEYIISNGYGDIDQLDDKSKLKKLYLQYQKLHNDMEEYLEKLGYEGG